MQGMELLKTLIEATGLPTDSVQREMDRILASKNLSAESVGLEDIREILAAYLQDVLVEAKNAEAG